VWSQCPQPPNAILAHSLSDSDYPEADLDVIIQWLSRAVCDNDIEKAYWRNESSNIVKGIDINQWWTVVSSIQ